MKLYIKFSIGFLLSIFLVESLVRLATPVMGPPLKSWNTMQDAKVYKLEESNNTHENEIFVFGNSTALIGINPSIMSFASGGKLKVFNAAMNGSTLIHMKTFASDYVIPKQRPKAIILFLAPGTLDIPKPKNLTIHPLSVSLISNETRSWLGDRLSLFEYRNNLRDPMTLNAFRKSLLNRKTGFGIVNSWASDLDIFGYSTLQYDSRSIIGGWDLSDLDESLSYDGKFLKSDVRLLRDLIEVSSKYGTRVIISTVPLPSLNAQYRLQVETLARTLNIPFISGNDAVTSGDFFADLIHLNVRGAEVFSEFIALELTKIGLLSSDSQFNK